jgi:hypothetical protein
VFKQPLHFFDLNTFGVRFGHSGKLTSPWGAGALLEYPAPSWL